MYSRCLVDREKLDNRTTPKRSLTPPKETQDRVVSFLADHERAIKVRTHLSWIVHALVIESETRGTVRAPELHGSAARYHRRPTPGYDHAGKLRRSVVEVDTDGVVVGVECGPLVLGDQDDDGLALVAGDVVELMVVNIRPVPWGVGIEHIGPEAKTVATVRGSRGEAGCCGGDREERRLKDGLHNHFEVAEWIMKDVKVDPGYVSSERI